MYSKPTLEMAKSLAKSASDRAELRKLLDGFDTPQTYANQRFDQTQALAEALEAIATAQAA